MNKPDFKKRAHNLDETRAYFDARVKSIHSYFPDEVWGMGSLNWPHWDKFRVLLCNVYGVSCVDQIPDELVEDANVTAIDMLSRMFAKNIQILERKQQLMNLVECTIPEKDQSVEILIENLTTEEAELITASIQKIAKKHEVEIKELKTITMQDKHGL